MEMKTKEKGKSKDKLVFFPAYRLTVYSSFAQILANVPWGDVTSRTPSSVSGEKKSSCCTSVYFRIRSILHPFVWFTYLFLSGLPTITQWTCFNQGIYFSKICPCVHLSLFYEFQYKCMKCPLVHRMRHIWILYSCFLCLAFIVNVCKYTLRNSDFECINMLVRFQCICIFYFMFFCEYIWNLTVLHVCQNLKIF